MTLANEGTELREPETDERYLIPGLSRGLAALHLFHRDKPQLKLTEIAEGLSLSRSAAYRLVYTLEKDHFLERSTGGRGARPLVDRGLLSDQDRCPAHVQKLHCASAK